VIEKEALFDVLEIRVMHGDQLLEIVHLLAEIALKLPRESIHHLQ
jgi:hypothetical protein